MTYTEWLLERQLALLRLAAGESADAIEYVEEIEEELRDEILNRQFKRNVNDAILSVVAVYALNGLAGLQRKRFARLAEIEVAAVLKALDLRQRGIDIGGVFIQGAAYADWVKKVQQDTRFALSRAIRLGVSAGETGTALYERLRPVIDKARRDVSAVTITGVAAAANRARQKVYESVAEPGDRIQHVSILDSRTSVICISRAGLKWSLPDYTPIRHAQEFRTPPLHIRCRSDLRLVRRGDDEEVPMFTEFMDKRPALAERILGKGRYALFSQGKITLSQLLDPTSLTPLTLEQLQTL